MKTPHITVPVEKCVYAFGRYYRENVFGMDFIDIHYYYFYYGLSERYVTWFKSYLSHRSSIVRTLGKISSPFPILSGVPQGSTLGPLLFNIFINDLCSKIQNSEFLLFADDLKIFRVIKSAKDCKLLQSDIDCVQKWCYENCMKINTLKTNIISFTSKTNSIYFNYHVCG
jgi:hypothetical protein